jgi:cysteine synthase
MKERGEQGSLLSLLCDSGERYLKTYFEPGWVQAQFGDIGAAQKRVAEQLGAN